jgi:hypothetical protein
MAKTITLKVFSDTTKASSGQIEAISQENAESATSSIVFTLPSLGEVFIKAAQWKESLRQYIPIRREQVRILFAASSRKQQPSRSEQDESYQICDTSKRALFESFNRCLKNEALEQWLDAALEASTEPVRIIIQTESLEVAALPWEQWEFWNDYYDQEKIIVIALSFSSKKNSILPSLPKLPTLASAKTKILVLLGDTTSQANDINLAFDEKEFQRFKADLNKLGDRADVKIHIHKPDRAKLEELLQEDWHIIYYGGHSLTLEEEKDGIFFLQGQTEVKISELETSFKQNINRGELRLLIANACQGLGTALRLAHLGLPNAIVMRESIPDDVAHDFLRYLLESFIIGLPITSAIQHCKPRLREAYDLRHQLPGASLLPVLCLTSDAMNKIDAPMIPLTGLHPICQEMRALANLAKARLTLENAKNIAALKVQESYAKLLQLKNKVTREDSTLEVSLEPLSCSAPRIVGQEIWEVDFLVEVQKELLVWGQGFVNRSNGNSELLLDVRPWSWTGISVVLEGQEIKQFSLDANAKIELNGESQKASFTKKALLLLEEAYRNTKQNYDHPKYVTEVKNFGGWLKDVNKKKFIKKLAALQCQGISKKEAQEQAYLESPFGRARYELGITEFEVILPEETFIPLAELVKQDDWTKRDAEDLRLAGVNDEQWSKILVPQYIVVSVAKRPWTGGHIT